MNDTDTIPSVISTAGAEIPYSSNDKNDASRPVISMAGAKIPYSSNDKNDASRLVISTEAEGSGEISRPWYRAHGGRKFLRSESREILVSPCRQVPPLGMTNGPKSCHQKIVMEKRAVKK